MLSILETEPSLPPRAAPGPVEPPVESPAATLAVPPTSGEFEIVLGRSQVASWLFMAVIAMAVCSSLAYLAGRSAAPRKAPAAAATSIATPAPAAALPADTSPVAALPSVSILAPPNAAPRSGAPLFAEPDAGQVYIQIGAVEKGMATILAEGLRSHGFEAFVASGPSEKVFRVLIGPLPNPEAFRQAKAAVDAIDLAAFARRYEK
jgi:cell division septation protein DedD